MGTTPAGADARHGERLDAGGLDAVICDMDGVLTDTARIHARAWKETFDAFLERWSEARGERQAPFALPDDYLRHVDGKPRYEGVRSFLSSRGIDLEEGSPDDAPDRDTVRGLGRHKNERYLARLREDGVEPFPDAVDFVRRLREAGIPVGVFSSSRNARHVLEEAGLLDRFDARVDGAVAREEGLEGKPAPDVLVETARRLDADPDRTAVLEDAASGVEAGRAGGFARVIGVARSGDGGHLERAGADAVVADLSSVEVRGGEGRRPIEALPPALDALDDIAGRSAGRDVVLFLDFDGTLAPITARREEAFPPEPTRELLAELARRRPVAVVSGRDLDDLMVRVDADGLYLAGSHGFQLAGPGGLREDHPEAGRFLPALDAAEKELERAVADMDGVDVERKRYAVAAHHRRAGPGAEGAVRRAAEQVRDAHPDLRLARGRRLFELRPALDWNKGRAVDWILEAAGLAERATFPLYVGDGRTDEDAFRAVADRGLGVLVRGREGWTRARYALDGPDAVRRFLAALDEKLPS